jgi:hypothetical protein
MKNAKTFYILLLMAGVLFSSISCAPGIRLNTRGVQGPEPTGNYTVIYYGCNFLNDLETIAFLEREGGEYHFEPYAPDFRYRVKKGVPPKEASETAMKFVSCNNSFSRAQIRSVLAPNGETIGYEVRPLYLPFTYGSDDVLDVNYRLKEGKVVITIRLLPSIETMLRDNRGNQIEK